MRMPRHWLFVTGGACLIAAIAVVGMSMGSARNVDATIGEPTTDPCLEAGTTNGAGDVVAAVQQPECVTITQGPPRTHTPTPEGTSPATEVVVETSTPAPTQPAATNTPTGGAGAGGVQPPNTGFGDDGGSGNGLWLLLAGATLAVVGAGATVAGIRSR